MTKKFGIMVGIAVSSFGFLVAGPAFAVEGDFGIGQGTIDQQAAQQVQQAQQTIAQECPDDAAKGCACKVPDGDPQTLTVGQCINEKQTCSSGVVQYSCCVCDQIAADGTRKTFIPENANQGYTGSSCAALCQKLNPAGVINTHLGAGTIPVSPTAAAVAPTVDQIKQQESLCFTRAECASAQYAGTFVADAKCPSGQGRCLAPEPSITLSNPIGPVSSVQGLRGFIATVFQYAVGIAAIAAAIMFVYGGFLYIIASSGVKIQSGKEIMVDAAVGLALTLAAVAILRTVNPATIDMTRLSVNLIKTQKTLSASWCKDIKSDKPILLVAAGSPPNISALQPNATFNITPKDAQCGTEYYAKDFGNNTCSGDSCSDLGDGYTCLPCNGSQGDASKECAGQVKGNKCVKVAWKGRLSWTSTVVQSVDMLLVCNWAQSPKYDVTSANIIQGPKLSSIAGLTGAGGGSSQTGSSLIDLAVKSGSMPYRLDVPKDIIAKGNAACANGGGFRGVILGAEYAHYEVGSLTNVTQIADVVLITKNTCGTPSRFSGYADGSATTFLDYKSAYWCNTHAGPDGGTMPLIDSGAYWSAADLQAAIDGKQPITCDITLNANNAPSDPGTKFNKGCTNTTVFP